MRIEWTPGTRGRCVRVAQVGVSLIEVLVAMLVVSFGVLALSGLMTNAARYGKTSEFRAVATLLANDAADRMRANIPGVRAGSYELTAAYEWLSEPPAAVAGCTEAASSCDAAGLAAKDLAEWRRSLFFGLPGGAGYIDVSDDFAAADVWVAWIDPAAVEEQVAGQDRRTECPAVFNTDDKPRCVYFRVGL